MSFEASYVTIMDRFNSQWAVLEPTVTVAWPNVDFNPDPGKPYVRVTVLPGDSRQAAIGKTRLWRNVGVVMVQIFVPLSQGDEAARALGDSVTTALRGVTVSGVHLKATSLRRVDANRQWLQHNASTPFEYDDVTTT